MGQKSKIFNQKKKFKLKYTLPGEYQFQENEDKGEFVDQNGNVIAQLWDKDSNPNGFVVAAVFMGEVSFKLIYYNRITILGDNENSMSGLALNVLKI